MEIKKNAGEKISPSHYGLPARTELRQKSVTEITICIYRKSRIIMKDGLNIVEKAEKIKLVSPEISVGVETTAPVCSKTRRFLIENDIGIVTV